jgi:hypothetical protein
MPPPIDPEQLGPHFRLSQGFAAGISRGRLAGPAFHRTFWGLRSMAAPAGIHDVAASYLPRMSLIAFFSHATAARLWDIPLPLRFDCELPLHVSVPHPHRAPEGLGIIGHRVQLDSLDLRHAFGLRMTSLERTVLDLAPSLNDEELLAAMDNILWRRRPAGMRATIPTITAALVRDSGRRGRGRFRALLPLASSRSDSDPETAFRLRFIRAGFPDVVPNEDIVDASGNFLAMPDLQIRAFRMAFDYEGDHHRTDRKQWRKDLRRVPLLQDANWHHTRLSGDDLADPRYILARTRRLLVERGWRP